MKKIDPSFDPSSCSYKLDGATRSQIEELLKNEDAAEGRVKKILRLLMDEDESNKNTLSYDSLARLHKYLQHADPDRFPEPFYMLLDKCKCIKPKPRENEQLETRLQQLRLRNSQAIYNKMASSVDRLIEKKIEEESSSKGDTSGGIGCDSSTLAVGKELRLLSGSMIAVINSFLVYICTFVFCYKALEYSLPQPHIVGQVLFGLLGSTVVACAELYFLARVI